jgi:hypothetical protein
MDPTFVMARTYLGEIYTKAGRYDEAVAEFDRVLELSVRVPMQRAAAGLRSLWQDAALKHATSSTNCMRKRRADTCRPIAARSFTLRWVRLISAMTGCPRRLKRAAATSPIST